MITQYDNRILIIQNIDETKYFKTIIINEALVKEYIMGPVSVAVLLSKCKELCRRSATEVKAY